ncbi:MAG: ABC transporter ATP-binding protein [Rickettsiales bacterium]|jgi:lipoprotein-releasing system ATP-binding protein|nr:ABC transporter ATP-binding protein [Rickettsiales bacterium]
MSSILKSLSKAPLARPVLSARDIGRTFIDGNGQPLAILRGGGFDLRRGEIVALVGPSGCGKSTLLQCVGLLDRPTRGQIIIAGVAANKLNDAERTLLRRHKIGFVYQRNNLLSDFSALENVIMPMLAAGVPEGDAVLRAKKLLKTMNILHRALHLPSEMSGGEQQRVAVARALANNPDIILADEPTGSLDPQHAKVVFNLLVDIVKKTGTAMLFVTHDLELAKSANRTITIKNGRIG